MNSKQKGSLAVSQCIAKMYEFGYEVLLPVGDRRPYDLVVDTEEGLSKVQCKFAGFGRDGKYRAYLRITGGNQSFHTAKKYTDDAFDLLYVYTEDGRHFLFDWKDVTCRNTLNVDSPKYRQFLL
jgi:hypothetical protein